MRSTYVNTKCDWVVVTPVIAEEPAIDHKVGDVGIAIKNADTDIVVYNSEVSITQIRESIEHGG